MPTLDFKGKQHIYAHHLTCKELLQTIHLYIFKWH